MLFSSAMGSQGCAWVLKQSCFDCACLYVCVCVSEEGRQQWAALTIYQQTFPPYAFFHPPVMVSFQFLALYLWFEKDLVQAKLAFSGPCELNPVPSWCPSYCTLAEALVLNMPQAAQLVTEADAAGDKLPFLIRVLEFKAIALHLNGIWLMMNSVITSLSSAGFPLCLDTAHPFAELGSRRCGCWIFKLEICYQSTGNRCETHAYSRPSGQQALMT